MGLIGDIYYSFRGDGARLQKDAQVEGDKAGQTLGARITAGFKKSWTGAEIGKGLVQGLGLAGGLGAATLVTNAIGKVADVIGDATQAQLEERKSLALLDSSLKANVKNWDGNTAAIEKVIASRTRLGFADDEQRESLARLVGATKDVNEALDLQRTAMDLARFKGISLMEASEALIKVDGGQYRILKTLIGSTKDITNETEALAAVRAVAAGAAEDLARTEGGELLAAQIDMDEALEQLGEYTLPLMVEGTKAAADVAQDLAGNLDGLADAGRVAGDVLGLLGVKGGEAAAGGFDLVHSVQDFMAILNPTKVSNTFGVLIDAVDNLGVDTTALRAQFRGMGVDIEDGLDHSMDSIESLRGAASKDLGKTETSLTGVGDAADDMAKGVEKGTEKAEKSIEELRDAAADAAQDMVDDYFDPIEEASEALDHHQANKAAVEARRLARTKAQARDAAREIIQTLDDQATSLVKLGSQGKLTSKQVDRFEADVKASYAALGLKVPKELQKIIERLRTTKQWTDKNYDVHVGITWDAGAITRLQNRLRTLHNLSTGAFRAEGGPVTAGQPYIVGERRAELFVPTENGRIVPRVPSSTELGAAAAAAGGDTNITVALPTTARPDPFEVATQLRRLNDFGVLSVR